MTRTRLQSLRLVAWIALIPIVVVVLLVAALAYCVWVVSLRLLVWMLWLPQGRRTLVIYSNSPHWKDYFEGTILPPLGRRTVVLNWSERKQWRMSLARSLFRLYGGPQNFNPLVVVIRPFGRATVFRFYPAFMDAKRGRPEHLHRLETELFSVVNPVAPA